MLGHTSAVRGVLGRPGQLSSPCSDLSSGSDVLLIESTDRERRHEPETDGRAPRARCRPAPRPRMRDRTNTRKRPVG